MFSISSPTRLTHLGKKADIISAAHAAKEKLAHKVNAGNLTGNMSDVFTLRLHAVCNGDKILEDTINKIFSFLY